MPGFREEVGGDGFEDGADGFGVFVFDVAFVEHGDHVAVVGEEFEDEVVVFGGEEVLAVEGEHLVEGLAADETVVDEALDEAVVGGDVGDDAEESADEFGFGVNEWGCVLFSELLFAEIRLRPRRLRDLFFTPLHKRQRELQDLSLHKQQNIEHLLHHLVPCYPRTRVL